jgi:branched-chain amino acid transport system substrate-binding protein
MKILIPLFLLVTLSTTLVTKNASCEELEPFVIGWLGPLTGPVASLGVDSLDVAKNLINNANKMRGSDTPKIELIVEDDQYKTNQTIIGYTNLVRKGAKVIIAITYGGVLAIADRAEHDNVLIIDPLDCDDQLAALPKNTFCVAKKTELIGIKNAQVVAQRKEGPTAILFADGDPFMPKVAQAMKSELERSGIAVPIFDGLIGENKDFKGSLTKAKNAGVKSIAFYGNDEFGLALRQARQMGIEAQFYSLCIIKFPGFKAAADSSAEGTIVAGWFAPKTESYKQFLSEFIVRNKREPLVEASTVPTYDVITLLNSYLMLNKSPKGKVDVTDLRKYLYSVKDYQGLSGTITVDNTGAVMSLPVESYIYKHSEFEPLS